MSPATTGKTTQKDDLERQKQVLERYCARRNRKLQGRTCEVLAAPGSCLNYHKKGLKRLLDALGNGQVGRPVITHQDRRLRFGAEPVFAIGEARNKDVLEIITVFSARLYGSHSCENQKLPDGLKAVVEVAPDGVPTALRSTPTTCRRPT